MKGRFGVKEENILVLLLVWIVSPYNILNSLNYEYFIDHIVDRLSFMGYVQLTIITNGKNMSCVVGRNNKDTE